MLCPNGYSRYESDVEKRCSWEHCVKTCLETFATIPQYHVVITYVCLGACTLLLHLINFNQLFNRLLPLCQLISSFSYRHKWQSLLRWLYGGHSLKILQVTFGIKLFLLISQYSLENSLSFASSSWVKDLVWL